MGNFFRKIILVCFINLIEFQDQANQKETVNEFEYGNFADGRILNSQ